MKLHTFGDSHAEAGFMHIPASETIFEEIDHNQIGPVTMARFGFEKLRVLDITTHRWICCPDPPTRKDYDVKDGDVVVFCFGEIDCRAHLLIPEERERHYKENIPVESINAREIIDVLVDRYFEAIKANVEKFNHLHTMVYNVVPTSKDEELEPNATFPRVGSNESRKSIVLYMNSKIKEYCETYGYGFFDVYDKYCDKDGYLNRELASDVHIGNPIYILEFIKNLKLDVL